MKWLLLALLVVFNFVRGQTGQGQLEVYSSPSNPVKNEPFELTIKGSVPSGLNFRISFGARDFEVLSRKIINEEPSTKMLNGQVVSVQKVGYSYSLITQKSGLLSINNIRLEAENHLLAMAKYEINVQNAPPRSKDQFLEVVVAKKAIIKNEGFNLKYYLLTATPFLSQEVKQYPKLDSFIKRFYDINPRIESVVRDGRVYSRAEVYSARLYSKKIGKVEIDPISIKVTYPKKVSSQIFGNIVTLASEKVFIDVADFPVANFPPNFTGLIGEHRINLTTANTFYNINEPISVKLIVTGPGNLEELSAPSLYVNKDLEDFDVKMEMSAVNETTMTKTFEYTYLGRSKLTLPESKLVLSMLNPESGNYFAQTVKLPAITIGNGNSNNSGETTNAVNENPSSLPAKNNPSTMENTTPLADHLFPPEFISSFDKMNFLKMANIIISAIIFLIIISFVIKRGENDLFVKKIAIQINKIKKSGINYSSLYNIIYDSKDALLSDHSENKAEFKLKDIVERSLLSENAKKYFQVLISRSENETFNKKNEKISFRKKYFQEILSLVKRQKKND